MRSDPAAVDAYLAGFPPEVAERLALIRRTLLKVAGPDSPERMRYGMAAVMYGREGLHYAGWKKHIGMYPTPVFAEPLESRVAKYRSTKNAVSFPHDQELPIELIEQIARAVMASH